MSQRDTGWSLECQKSQIHRMVTRVPKVTERQRMVTRVPEVTERDRVVTRVP